MITKRAARPAKPADPATTVRPRRKAAAKTATVPPATEAPIDNTQLDAAILRFLRRFPNQTVDLSPLAEELAVDPYRMQLAVEELGRRRMVVVPFIEPGTAGGATISQVGVRWLLDSEGGKPADKPDRVEGGDEARPRLRRGRTPSPRRGLRSQVAHGQPRLIPVSPPGSSGPAPGADPDRPARRSTRSFRRAR